SRRQRSVALRQLADQREHRQVHRDDDAADRDSQKSNQRRFHQRQQVRDRSVYFLFVKVGNLTKHRVQGTRLLANADHLRNHVRENLRRAQRLNKALALFDGAPDGYDRFLDYDVAGSSRRNVERLQNRNTRRQQSRKGARKPRNADLQEYWTENRDLQQNRIDYFSALRRFVIELQAD